jgi:hypothetical protein
LSSTKGASAFSVAKLEGTWSIKHEIKFTARTFVCCLLDRARASSDFGERGGGQGKNCLASAAQYLFANFV